MCAMGIRVRLSRAGACGPLKARAGNGARCQSFQAVNKPFWLLWRDVIPILMSLTGCPPLWIFTVTVVALRKSYTNISLVVHFHHRRDACNQPILMRRLPCRSVVASDIIGWISFGVTM